MKVVHAVLEDAKAIAQVHVLTWKAAYKEIVSAEYLQTLSVPKQEAIWKNAILKGSPEVMIAKSEDKIVGWIAFGPSRDIDAAHSTGEIWAIYVKPSFWSLGVGRLLWLQACTRLSEQNYKIISVWVLSENTRAIKFYRAVGFVADLSHQKQIVIGNKELKEIRYMFYKN